MRESDAAVAILHAREPEESTLLMRRTERESDSWSGHWSFPGGRREPGDPDLLATALRELEEECGIRLTRPELAEALPEAIAGRHHGSFVSVAPFVFRVDRQHATVLDAEEAAEAVWVPFELLRDPARHRLRPVPRLPENALFPAVDLNGTPLWGFTYRVLVEWLGLCPRQRPSEQAGAVAARLVLDLLLSFGLPLRSGWSNREALVSGPIPVAQLLRHFALPGPCVPTVSRVEVHSDRVVVTGHRLEEYVIRSA